MNKQEHLLVILMEECAELQKECAKALRFGMDDHEPGSKETNGQRIIHEFDDVVAVGEMLFGDNLFNCTLVNDKKVKIAKWMVYSKEKGTLTE